MAFGKKKEVVVNNNELAFDRNKEQQAVLTKEEFEESVVVNKRSITYGI